MKTCETFQIIWGNFAKKSASSDLFNGNNVACEQIGEPFSLLLKITEVV